MTRPNRNKINISIINEKLSTGCVSEQKRAGLQVLRSIPEFEHLAMKVSKCRNPFRCNSKYCPTCSNPRNSESFRLVEPKPPEENADKKDTVRSSNEYRVRAGYRMISSFHNAPRVMTQCITINLALVPISGSIKEEIIKWRKKLREIFKTFSYGAIVRGKFDYVMKYADMLNFDIPASELPSCIGDDPLPHKRYAMLHFHAVVFDPLLSRSDIRDALAVAFPGRSRICVKRAQKDVINSDGTITGGTQGYLEYLSMEKIEVKFGNESYDAFVEYVTLDLTWGRSNANFSYGKPICKSEVIIDQEIVLEMERERRNENISNNWAELGAARRFLHIWMTGVSSIRIAIIGGRIACTNHFHFQSKLIHTFNLYGNWIRLNAFEASDFRAFTRGRMSYLDKYLRI